MFVHVFVHISACVRACGRMALDGCMSFVPVRVRVCVHVCVCVLSGFYRPAQRTIFEFSGLWRGFGFG